MAIGKVIQAYQEYMDSSLDAEDRAARMRVLSIPEETIQRLMGLDYPGYPEDEHPTVISHLRLNLRLMFASPRLLKNSRLACVTLRS